MISVYFYLIIDLNKLLQEKCDNKTDNIWRRNHVGLTVGYNLFIHGGISETGKYLSDSFCLNYNTLKWFTVETKGNGPGKVAFHSGVVVYPLWKRSNNHFNLFRFPDTLVNSTRNSSVNLFITTR